MSGTLTMAAPRVQLGAALELLKPITWFAPMWAFGCGVVSAGVPVAGRWGVVAAGVALAGPLVCGMSQAANDWYDRHVDAINEPARPIPSGRLPGRTGLFIAVGWTVLSMLVAAMLGRWVLGAALLGVVLAWLYSAPPVRLKRNGWWGNAACAACYEGLPWFTGAAVMTGTLPDAGIVTMAALYSLGAHGIMTLNDFKSVDGDRQMGIDSLPVLLGPGRAARLACWAMAAPQGGGDRAAAGLGASAACRGRGGAAGRAGGAHDPLPGRSPALGTLVQRHRHHALCAGHAAHRLRAAGRMTWFAIMRLGLIQASLGAVVVLVTSTLNRVMIVELSLPALVPGALVALHYIIQVLRPRLGFGSDVGGRRTPWVLGGMALLALGGTGAAMATAVMADRTACWGSRWRRPRSWRWASAWGRPARRCSRCSPSKWTRSGARRRRPFCGS